MNKKSNEVLEIPDGYEEQLKNLLEQAKEEMHLLGMQAGDEAPVPPYKSISPSMGFCIKAKDDKGQKVFMNICHSPELPAPVPITENELLTILSSDDPSNYRVPLSLGDPHTECDKENHPCTAYDIIVNTGFYDLLQKNELFKGFMMSLAVEGIENKYGITVDRETYIILKNKRYFGTMPQHHIRTTAKPLITEVESDTATNKSQPQRNVPTKAVPPPNTATPVEYTLTREPAVGQPEYLVAEFKLPGMRAAEDLTLDLGEDRILLSANPNKYFLDIFLPYNVHQDSSRAQFDRKKQVLTVTMPVLPELQTR